MKSNTGPLTKIKWLGLVMTVLVAGGAMGEDLSTWKDLPPLVLQECIDLDQKIEPIPVTPMHNDFLVVTTYEEKAADEDEIRETHSYLNLYLVGGLLMLTRSEGIYYNSQLVVDRLIYDMESATKTNHKWTMLDRNRDGVVDQAVFQKIVKDAGNNVLNVEAKAIPEEGFEALQSYFRKAIHLVRQRSQAGFKGMCISI